METVGKEAEVRLQVLGCVVSNNSIEEIVDKMGVGKSDIMNHLNGLYEERLITKRQLATYDERQKYNYGDNPVLELFRQNVPPMRIAEKLGISRQAVYSYLSTQKKKGVITDDEYQKRSKLWKRKHLEKFEDSQENLDLVLKVVNENPEDTPHELAEKVGVKVPLLKRTVSFLKDRGEISEEVHERIVDYVRLQKEERDEFVRQLCIEYKDMSFKKLAKKYGKTVRGIILMVEGGIKLGYTTEEEYHAITSSRRTNKKAFDESVVRELVEKNKNGASINTLSKEYGRCPTIIRKYIDANKEETQGEV
jgi:DNA-binding MarR family transcriptional regulator/biotin operon repressor